MSSIRERLAQSNDPRLTKRDTVNAFPAIPEPDETNIVEVLTALKTAVEQLNGFRGDKRTHAVLVEDLEELGLIAINDVNGYVERV